MRACEDELDSWDAVMDPCRGGLGGFRHHRSLHSLRHHRNRAAQGIIAMR